MNRNEEVEEKSSFPHAVSIAFAITAVKMNEWNGRELERRNI